MCIVSRYAVRVNLDYHHRLLFYSQEVVRRIYAYLMCVLYRLNAYESWYVAFFQAYRTVLRLHGLRSRIRNFCLLTGATGSIWRFFRMTRHQFKGLATYGYIAGIRTASW